MMNRQNHWNNKYSSNGVTITNQIKLLCIPKMSNQPQAPNFVYTSRWQQRSSAIHPKNAYIVNQSRTLIFDLRNFEFNPEQWNLGTRIVVNIKVETIVSVTWQYCWLVSFITLLQMMHLLDVSQKLSYEKFTLSRWWHSCLNTYGRLGLLFCDPKTSTPSRCGS